MARGQALWASIYEPHAEKLYNKLGSYHPDFISECLSCKVVIFAHVFRPFLCSLPGQYVVVL